MPINRITRITVTAQVENLGRGNPVPTNGINSAILQVGFLNPGRLNNRALIHLGSDDRSQLDRLDLDRLDLS